MTIQTNIQTHGNEHSERNGIGVAASVLAVQSSRAVGESSCFARLLASGSALAITSAWLLASGSALAIGHLPIWIEPFLSAAQQLEKRRMHDER